MSVATAPAVLQTPALLGSGHVAPCPICLEDMCGSDDAVSLGCGHVFHESCLTGSALRRCALCRTPVRPDKIKPASKVLGAQASSGACRTNWTIRSGSVVPPASLATVRESRSASPPSSERSAARQRRAVTPQPETAAAAAAAAAGGDPGPSQQRQQQRVRRHSVQAPVASSRMPEPLLAEIEAWHAPIAASADVSEAAAEATGRRSRRTASHQQPASLAGPSAAWQAGGLTQAQQQLQAGEDMLGQGPPLLPYLQDRAPQRQEIAGRRRDAKPARDIPKAEAVSLLEGIQMQLSAVAAAMERQHNQGSQEGPVRTRGVRPRRHPPPPPAPAGPLARQPSLPMQRQAFLARQRSGRDVHGAAEHPPPTVRSWTFCIDVSSSMGSSRAWEPTAVSRLCFALATLACVVDSQVDEGDWVLVTGFDYDLAVLKPWFRKPDTFDRAALLAELTGAVRHCGLRRWGTRLCSALRRVVTEQAAHARSLVAAAGGPLAAAAAHPLHSFVLLTDGDADDGGTAFRAAAAVMRDPPFEAGGFRALLMHIDFQQGRNRDWLRRLASAHGGTRLPYVDLLELSLPARLNLASLSSAGSMMLSAAAGGSVVGSLAGGWRRRSGEGPGSMLGSEWLGGESGRRVSSGPYQSGSTPPPEGSAPPGSFFQQMFDRSFNRDGQPEGGSSGGGATVEGTASGPVSAGGSASSSGPTGSTPQQQSGGVPKEGASASASGLASDDSLPVLAMSQAILAFSSTLGSQPSARLDLALVLDGSAAGASLAGATAAEARPPSAAVPATPTQPSPVPAPAADGDPAATAKEQPGAEE